MNKPSRNNEKCRIDELKRENDKLLRENERLKKERADRKRSGKELRQSLKQLENLESIINRSPAMVILWQIRDGWPVEYASENVRHVLGYSAEDFMSGEISWTGVTFEDDIPGLEKEVAGFLRKRAKEFQQEYRLVAKSGGIRWMRNRNTVLYDAGGVPTHIQSIVIDITEIKRIEEALSQIEEALSLSEQKYKDLVENINEVIYSIDLDGKILYVSPTVEALMGYKPSELVGKIIDAFFYPEDIPIVKENIQKIFGGSTEPGEYRIVNKDGMIRWIQTSSRLLVKNSVTVGIQGVLIDITQRKAMENELKKSEEKYRYLVENINDVIYVVNPEGVITYISPTVEGMSGYRSDEIIGRFFFEFIDEKDLAGIARLLENPGIPVVNGECRFRTKSGIHRWLLFSSRPRYENDTVTEILGVCTDITERKEMEEQLGQTKKELEMKSKNLEETNTALKVLLNHQNLERENIERNIKVSITKLVEPYLDRIRSEVTHERHRAFLEIIGTNLSEITKPFISNLNGCLESLTATEIRVANLIRENTPTSDIAQLLGISESTVFFHRRNIRKKLDLKNKGTNLQSFLQSFDHRNTALLQ